jgi:beta-lactamase regulating signal transducer with metallopeptidase domain
MMAWWSASLAALEAEGLVSTLDTAVIWLLEALLRVTLDGGLVALPVWLACRYVPSLPASARAWLWWCVSLKLLLSLSATPLLSIPVLPAAWTTMSATGSLSGSLASRDRAARTPLTPTLGTTSPDARSGRHSISGGAPQAARGGQPERIPATNAGVAPTAATRISTLLWNLLRLATAAWGAAIGIQFVLLLCDAVRLHRLVRRAGASTPAIADEHEDLAKDLGLKTIPALRESADVTAPQVVGLLRPTVLLPAGTATLLSPSERTMVLCHELAHVRRRDLVLGWIPALAERLLVWHPLARLCAGEYVLAREAACDALVLRTLDAPPRDYGRLLVRLGVHTPAARIAAAGTSPTVHLLRRRLHMLQQASLSPRAVTGIVLTAALVALVPLRLVAVPIAADTMENALTESAATAATARLAPVEAVVEMPATPQRERGRDERRERLKEHTWIYFYPGSDSVTMHGDTDDIEMARRLRGEPGRAFFVFRQEGEVYTISDGPTLARIGEIFEPQRRLGERQGELGARQGALGIEQGRLGMRQGRLGMQQGEFGGRQAELSAQLAEIEARRQRVAIERLRQGDSRREASERAEEEARARTLGIERQLRELEARHEALSVEQEALGREQEALGRQQETLGVEQERLGEQQERIARSTERELAELLERAIASGIAKAVK